MRLQVVKSFIVRAKIEQIMQLSMLILLNRLMQVLKQLLVVKQLVKR